MAGFAGVGSESGDILLVTVRAGERFVPGHQSVSVQGKSQQLVRELPTLQDRQRGVRATVLRVAIAAFQTRIFLVHDAVQRHHVLHLKGNLAMAVNAQIGHRERIPRRAVTGLTLAARLGMRADPAQHLS